MLIRSSFLCAAALLGIAACSSTPTQFYTLVPAAPERSLPVSTQFQIEVLPVDVPAQVEVPQIVVRESGGEMTRAESHRWIAPIDAEIRSALSADLSRALAVRDVYGLTYGTGIKTYRIALKVQRFDSVPGSYARIDAVWTVHPLDQEKLVDTCSSSVSEPIGANYDALAQGHQQAINAIAKQIAASVSALQSGVVVNTCS